MDRRNFIHKLTRGGIFSLITGTSIYLVSRAKNPDDASCNFDFICQDCRKKRICQLPEASKFRLNMKKEH